MFHRGCCLHCTWLLPTSHLQGSYLQGMEEPWLAGGAADRVRSQGQAEWRCPPLPRVDQPWRVPKVHVLMWVASVSTVFTFCSQRALCKIEFALGSWGLALLPSALTCPPTTHIHIHSCTQSRARLPPSSGHPLISSPFPEECLPHVILTLEIGHTQTVGGSLERKGFRLGPLAGLWPRSPSSSW